MYALKFLCLVALVASCVAFKTMSLKRSAMKMGVVPEFGFGTWKIPNEDAESQVYEAIKSGVRHIDCAADYGNELECGNGIRKALNEGIVKREELFIVTKLWQTHHAPEHVPLAVEKHLKDLQCDYLDLFLIHFPIALKYIPIEQRYPAGWFVDPEASDKQIEQAPVPLFKTWASMEEQVKAGKIKHIGVSNYNVQHMMELLRYAEIKPLSLQVELHPYLQQQNLVDFCLDNGIEPVAYSPLGSSSYVEIGLDRESAVGPLKEPVINDIAKRLGKSPAQVILRWNLQRGVAVIPKCSKKERILENMSLFDFELTDADMQSIKGLNKNLRFNDPGYYFDKKVGGPLSIFN